MGNYDRNVFLVAHSATSSNAVTQRSSRRPKLCFKTCNFFFLSYFKNLNFIENYFQHG